MKKKYSHRRHGPGGLLSIRSADEEEKNKTRGGRKYV
jgi:hypothetical protein